MCFTANFLTDVTECLNQGHQWSHNKENKTTTTTTTKTTIFSPVFADDTGSVISELMQKIDQLNASLTERIDKLQGQGAYIVRYW